MLGLLSVLSMPVDRAPADVWVAFPSVRSVDFGRPIPERWVSRLAAQPEVDRAEGAIIGFAPWTRQGANPAQTTTQVCNVVGARLDPQSLAAPDVVRNSPELLAALAEPMAVAVDESELDRLGVRGVGDTAEVVGRRVRVAGLVSGCRSLGGRTCFARRNRPGAAGLPAGSGDVPLARCKNPATPGRPPGA